MTDLKRNATRTRCIWKKCIIHQSLHDIRQILVRHRLEHLSALDRHHAVHIRRAGELGAAEGFVLAGESAVALLPDMPSDIFAAVV